MKKQNTYDYDELLVRIGAKIKMHRKRRQMSQSQLAQDAGTHKASMSRIESGKSNFTYTTLIRISKALDVPIKDLIPENTQPPLS